MRKLLASALLGAMTLATPAMADTINFDTLSNGDVVTNQYAGVTFSSVAGSQILVTAQSLGSSQPNFICSGVGSSINCTDTVFVTFANAVSGLSFVAVGDNDTGVNGMVDVFDISNALLGTVNIIGDGNGSTPYTVDLSAFAAVGRIAISTTDPAGLGYDDFTFQAAATGGVPEPATWAMMLLGFGGIGHALRRRTRVATRIRFA